MQISKLFTVLLIAMGVAAAPAANPEPAPGAALEAGAPVEERNLHKCGKGYTYSHKKKQCIPKNQCKKKYYKKNVRRSLKQRTHHDSDSDYSSCSDSDY
ncbi:hypothetical protein ONS95_000361 [Cadophora gregata]|uniref:uncharacterized protein n=1 Tax=Cadophora gregata TaxID=51156 RepID=UPI0026DB68A7|nr:uncharacterized protein ONS95_000361 [Cadophora gregata]KAK0125630.1 hypothetical protein ONS96_009467 [Cadophora gregata f. sp. sojae]KAK0128391.1 hypothetical protein ONS95_000361 [Cadophora gregata]